MKKYHYTMTIDAQVEKDADEKMQALIILASKLSAKELSGLAHVVKTDPTKTALAKKYLGL